MKSPNNTIPISNEEIIQFFDKWAQQESIKNMVMYMMVYQCGECKVEHKCWPEDEPVGWRYIPEKKVYLCPEHAKENQELKKEE